MRMSFLFVSPMSVVLGGGLFCGVLLKLVTVRPRLVACAFFGNVFSQSHKGSNSRSCNTTLFPLESTGGTDGTSPAPLPIASNNVR